jgi:transcriptional regulator with XRE-family HTH domain|tara:strand:- start:89 stop:316 length:228 start_codon:yes stop_codon:yes gene_type:complete
VSKHKEIDRELERFGACLRRQRTSKKITQETLAELSDLNVRTIQKIEAGQTNILITTMLRLRNAIGCEFDDLFPH